MATRLKCNPFELLAFEAAVSEHPGDVTGQHALRDFLEDNGYSHIGARQRVARVVREALELKLVARCKEIFTRFPIAERDVIHRLLTNGRFPNNPWPTLNVWPRFQPVAYTSLPGYFEDHDGNRFSDPMPQPFNPFEHRWNPPRVWFDAPAALVWHMLDELSSYRQKPWSTVH